MHSIIYNACNGEMKQQIIAQKKPKATEAEETKEDKKEQVHVALRARER